MHSSVKEHNALLNEHNALKCKSCQSKVGVFYCVYFRQVATCFRDTHQCHICCTLLPQLTSLTSTMSGCNVCDLINDPNSYPPKPPMSTTGKILVGVCVGTVGAITAATASFTILPALRKFVLPYVPATTQQVNNVMTILRGRSGTLVDLGSGDGRSVSIRAIFGVFGCNLFAKRSQSGCRGRRRSPIFSSQSL
jgi:hypothetical protein